MAYKPLIILEKQSGTPLQTSVTTSRTSAPIIIQPDYQFDASDGDARWLQNASIGTGLYWNSVTHKIDVSVASGSGDVTTAYIDGSLAHFVRDTSFSGDFYWNGGYLYSDVSVIADGVSRLYVDGSLAIIKATYIPDISLNDSYFKWIGGYLEPSVASGMNDATKEYIDGSISALNASVGIALSVYATNASVALALGPYATNASVGLAFGPYATNASVGIALSAYATNSSVNITMGEFKNYVDGSLFLRVTNASLASYKFIKQASLGPDFVWDSSGLLDVSIGFIGYLSDLKDVSIYPVTMGTKEGRLLTYDMDDFVWRDGSSLADYNFCTNVSVNNALYLNKLRDVSILSPENTQVLQYTGQSWLNRNVVNASLYFYSKTDIDFLFFTKEQVQALDVSYYASKANYTYVDGSLALKTGYNYVDGSLAKFIRSASTGTGLYWNSGLLDVSVVAGVSISYIDGSLNNKVNGTTRITVAASAPGSPASGDLWVDIS